MLCLLLSSQKSNLEQQNILTKLEKMKLYQQWQWRRGSFISIRPTLRPSRRSRMAEEELKLFGFWTSPYSVRVRWALKLKQVDYEYIEENLPQKSSMLLLYNPVHKKVPVLVHNGRPIAESLVILEYIDETWKHCPLLPQDPFEKAKARFWVKFADDKCVASIDAVFGSKGDEQQKALEEARANFKILEGALEGRPIFGGNRIDFLDIGIGWIGYWTRVVEEVTKVKLIDVENMASLDAWFRRFLEQPIIQEYLPPMDKMVEHIGDYHRRLTASST